MNNNFKKEVLIGKIAKIIFRLNKTCLNPNNQWCFSLLKDKYYVFDSQKEHCINWDSVLVEENLNWTLEQLKEIFNNGGNI